MVTWNSRNTITTAVLLSALVAGIIGLGVSYASRPTPPAAQTRDFYLFAVDQQFNSTAAGLKADYDFSANVITVNKGDRLMIHFYNPTDEAHIFTIVSPYTIDVVLPAMTSSLISRAKI